MSLNVESLREQLAATEIELEQAKAHVKRRAGNTLGRVKKGLEATLHPTSLDIAWAAGIYEGEGSCKFHAGTQRATVPQKDPWLLHKLRALFGGSIGNAKPDGSIQVWQVSGARARGFLQTILLFLSPRRQDQVKSALFPSEETRCRRSSRSKR